jgi:hypothetical protein
VPLPEYAFPTPAELDHLAAPEDRNLSRAKPHKKHYWLWPKPAGNSSEQREQRN